jgi:hypothetical protein
MPPDTHATSVPFATSLAQAPRLVVRQRTAVLEDLTGVESRGRYTVFTEDGAFTAGFAEHGQGMGAFLGRWFLKARRPFTFGLYPAEHPGQPLLELERPWTWFLSRLEVRQAATGRVVGRLRQRWGWLEKRLDLEAPDGRLLARLTGPLFRPWTLLLQAGPEGGSQEIGRIEKRWSGFLREAFTDADTFLVTLPPRDLALRQLVLAAAVLVDFLWWEHRG